MSFDTVSQLLTLEPTDYKYHIILQNWHS